MERKKSDKSHVDLIIRVLACATVILLACIAAAISYSHMHELAIRHGETGWRAHAFPLSVDGIELTASLVLLAHRRAGTHAGLLPWVALGAGTLASLAANVAVGAVDLVGRAVAGWPAIALLVAVKMLAGLLESPAAKSELNISDTPGMAAETSEPKDERDATQLHQQMRPNDPTRAGSSARARANRTDLEDAARTAAAELLATGQRLNRDTLTRTLRAGGHAVSNATASELLAHVRRAPEPFNGTATNIGLLDLAPEFPKRGKETGPKTFPQ